MKNRLVWVVLLAFLFSACTTAGPEPQAPSSTPTTLPNPPTVAASPTAEPPTSTPLPPTETAIPTSTPTPRAYAPGEFPENVNPLTGLVVGDESRLERRPVAVKVQMFPRGQRPPFGVSLADVVFDYYQNAGATRLMAIFYGTDAERVSPIRSGRMFDIQVLKMFQSIFAFGSADQRILDALINSTAGNRLVIRSSNTCPPDPMCRVDPNGFNYLITDTKLLSEYASRNNINNTSQKLDYWAFDPDTPAGGETGEQVFVRYNLSNYNRWDFDPQTGRYLRFQETVNDDGSGERYAPLVDGLTEEQIAADNVVVLLATHTYAFNTRAGNSEIVDIPLTGTGTAYAFRDGQAYTLKWNRANPEAPFTLTQADGSLYPLKPGNTWVQVIGQSSQVTRQEPVATPTPAATSEGRTPSAPTSTAPTSGGQTPSAPASTGAAAADTAWRFTFSIP